jgi:hypothetical protein
MERRQRRSFTDDYKRQAVDLVASSGRSVGSVAKELGLRVIAQLHAVKVIIPFGRPYFGYEDLKAFAVGQR